MPQATLYNPETKERKAVEANSQEATDFFGQGFKLETSYNKDTGISTFDVPTADVSINAETLGETETPIDLPDIPDESDTSDAIVAGAGAMTKEDYKDLLTPEDTEKKAEEATVESEVSGILEELKGLPEERQEMLEEAGVPDISREYAQLNTKIRTKIAEYDALDAELENQPISMQIIRRQQSSLKRARASEIGMLQARAQGLAGEIATAKQTINESIDLKFQTAELSIGYYQNQLENIRDDIAKEDATDYAAAQLMIDDLRQEQADRKEEEKNIQNLVITAQQNGADSRLLDMIGSANTLEEATQIAGELAFGENWQYVGSYEERDRLVNEEGYEMTQSGGRTYVRPAEEGLLSIAEAKTLGVPYGTTKQEAINMGITPTTSSSSSGDKIVGGGITKANVELIGDNLLSQKGGDGFVSPDDYNLAKQDWVQAGGEPDEFDKKFAGRRDPDNNYYEVTGETFAKNEKEIWEYVEEDYSKEAIVDAGYDEDTVKKIIEEKKERDKSNSPDKWEWIKFWK